MILPTLPIRRRRRVRRPEPAPVAPPARVYVTVGHVEGQRFCWYFDTPYADPTTPWSAADFAGLLVAGRTPVDIDEVIGGDGTLTLIYDLQDPDAPGLTYDVFAAPAVLHFDGDKPLGVPQNGIVLP